MVYMYNDFAKQHKDLFSHMSEDTQKEIIENGKKHLEKAGEEGN